MPLTTGAHNLLKELYLDAKEMLKSGTHPGACDNEEDENGNRGPCSYHLAMYHHRENQLKKTVAAVEEFLGLPKEKNE